MANNIENLDRYRRNLSMMQQMLTTPGYMGRLGTVHEINASVTVHYQAYSGAKNYHHTTVADHGTAFARAIQAMFPEIIAKAVEIAQHDFDEARVSRRGDLEKELAELTKLEEALKQTQP
jgi:hypothetical protein